MDQKSVYITIKSICHVHLAESFIIFLVRLVPSFFLQDSKKCNIIKKTYKEGGRMEVARVKDKRGLAAAAIELKVAKVVIIYLYAS